MKKLLFILLLFTYALTAHAQCQFLRDGEALEKKGKYQDAIRKYILAEKDCGKDAVTAPQFGYPYRFLAARILHLRCSMRP